MSDDDAYHIDDSQIGRILSRREALALFAAGAVLLPACRSGDGDESASGGAGQPSTTSGGGPATTAAGGGAATTAVTTATGVVAAPTCVVRPALTEGPFFVDEKLNRSDIRSDPSDGAVSAGVPLRLTFRVSQTSGGQCRALQAANVDVWQCDANGLYSDVSASRTVGKKFLRGYQATDASGNATFTTIYPGGYQGRAVHIHFMIRTTQGQQFTSQLFFDDNLSNQVFASPPYRTGSRTLNSADSIFRQASNQLTLDVKPDGQGYASTFEIGLQA